METSRFNQLLHEWLAHHEPPLYKGKRPKIYYATQVGATGPATPTFLFFTNLPQAFTDSYQRYFIKQIRQHWPFLGSPIRLVFKGKKKDKNG